MCCFPQQYGQQVNNFYGSPQTPQLNALVNPMQANGLGAMGYQQAVNQFTNPLFSNPASARLLSSLPVTSAILGGGNQFGSGFGQPGFGANPMMGGGFGMGMPGMGMNSFGANPMMGGGLSPFSMATMPFGNPMLTPQALQQQQMMQQAQQQQQPKKADPLKIFGIALGGILLLNMLTKGGEEGSNNGGGLGNILKSIAPMLGGLFGGGK